MPQELNFFPFIISNNSLYIGSISTLWAMSRKKKKIIAFPNYFIQQSQWIILKPILHYDTSQSCSILVTWTKKLPITKVFKDTIQKVTNASPRQTALLSVWINNSITNQTFADSNININKCWHTPHHFIFKADDKTSWQLYLFTSNNKMHITWN